MTALRPTTFRGRLAVSMTAVAFTVLGVAGVLIYVRVQRALLANLDGALLTIARTEIASAFDEPGKPVHVHDEDTPEPITLPVGSGYEKFARITIGTGEVVAATANLAAHSLPDDDEARARAVRGEIAFADLRAGGASFRGVYYPIAAAPKVGTVVLVAVPEEPIVHALHAITGALLVSLGVAALAAGWLAGRVARRLTDPLERIASAARAIGPADVAASIPDVSSDAELRTLTDILNGMLRRLDASLQAERQAADAQRRFVADASHELRTPLTNLRGTIEVALRHPRSAEEYRDTLTSAAREIERLSRLANDLLMLSRADAGRLPYLPAPCDLASIAHEAVDAYANRAAAERVTLRLDAPGRLPIVGDAGRLRQVVDNLLDNAIRHAPSDSAVLVTAAARNGSAVLRVRDAGPGLTRDEQARVFDRFYRADASRTRHSGGHGLGLTIAKAIVEAHGGTLAVESEPGSGATFEARLPTATVPSQPPAV